MAADRPQSSKIKSPKQRREAKNNRSLIGAGDAAGLVSEVVAEVGRS